MENNSLQSSFILTLDPFVIPMGGKYPIFIVGLGIYLFCVFSNLTILALIVAEKNLHKPMYFILFSLPLNDLIGITAMLPKVLSDILTETNTIYYSFCVLQGFFLHIYGGGVLFILAAMAFDRYIAICKPLRYNTIMTPYNILIIIILVWGIDFILIISLFSIQIRLNRCRNSVLNVFCDNPSLLKLSCADTSINNILGLFNTAVIQVISVTVQMLSYVKILIVCLATRKSEAKNKAINTCVAQLIIFCVFEFVGTFTILSHRFKNVSENLQKIMGMLIFIIPPLFNPLVYGLKSKEIKKSLIKVFNKTISF
uniref:Odorant receptor, family 71, subfamily AQ, member 1 n=2 Tax=Lepisosteus oculatus TaxID=7918 RepID=W5NNC3_LEPOC